MLQYSRKLSIFQKRATLVQEALDELLSNGELSRDGAEPSLDIVANVVVSPIDDDLAAMYLTAKLQGKPRSADDHEEIELLLESFSKQCEEIVSEVETLSVSILPLPEASYSRQRAHSGIGRFVGEREAYRRHHRIDLGREPQFSARPRLASEHCDPRSHCWRDGCSALRHERESLVSCSWIRKRLSTEF